MIPAIGVKVKTSVNGQETVTEYKSLYSCAKFYGLCVPTLRQIIASDPFKKKSKWRGTLPDDVTFELYIPEKSKKDKTKKLIGDWHCDVCNKDMKSTSKSLHLMSVKHKLMIDDDKK